VVAAAFCSVDVEGIAVLSWLADLVDRRPWRLLAVVFVVTAIAAPLGGSVHEHLKPRGFEVAGSGSAQAREAVARAAGVDPAISVLALVRLGAPVTSAGSQETIAAVETKLRGLLPFPWVDDQAGRPGSSGQSPPRVSMAMAIRDSGEWYP
jgi:hypothetical protein